MVTPAQPLERCFITLSNTHSGPVNCQCQDVLRIIAIKGGGGGGGRRGLLCKANQKDKEKKVSSINRFGNARNGYIQIRAP